MTNWLSGLSHLTSRAFVTIGIFFLLGGIFFPRNFNRDFQWLIGLRPNILEASASGGMSLRVLAPIHELQYAQVPGMQGNSISIGLEHDLLLDFARSRGYRLEFIPYETSVEAEIAFLRGKGDLLIGRWAKTKTPLLWRETLPFEMSRLALYCPQTKKNKQKKYSHAYVDHRYFHQLMHHSRIAHLTPQMSFQQNTFLLEQLENQETSCAYLEEREGDFELKFFPSLKKISTRPEKLSMVWRVSQNNKHLQTQLNLWIAKQKKMQRLTRHQSRYNSSIAALMPSDIRQLRLNIQKRLPHFEDLFQKSASVQNIPWTLLAAVGYQESHWDNEAVSPTKVRGIMQITRPTAAFLGITDIMDIEQTIPGGARYLEYLASLWPQGLPYREHIKLTLISYNLGYQHVLDCQQWLTERKLDPYSWQNLVLALKRKADPDYSYEFKWGYARGHEAIRYAERVLSFETFLRRVLSIESVS